LLGNPVRTKADGRVSIKRINDEAGLSRGAIYYYKDFVDDAKRKIEQYKLNKSHSSSPNMKQSAEQKLKSQRDNEKRLKDSYREQVSNLEGLNDALVTQNVSLAFRCMELQEEIRAITSGKIKSIKE